MGLKSEIPPLCAFVAPSIVDESAVQSSRPSARSNPSFPRDADSSNSKKWPPQGKRLPICSRGLRPFLKNHVLPRTDSWFETARDDNGTLFMRSSSIIYNDKTSRSSSSDEITTRPSSATKSPEGRDTGSSDESHSPTMHMLTTCDRTEIQVEQSLGALSGGHTQSGDNLANVSPPLSPDNKDEKKKNEKNLTNSNSSLMGGMNRSSNNRSRLAGHHGKESQDKQLMATGSHFLCEKVTSSNGGDQARRSAVLDLDSVRNYENITDENKTRQFSSLPRCEAPPPLSSARSIPCVSSSPFRTPAVSPVKKKKRIFIIQGVVSEVTQRMNRLVIVVIVAIPGNPGVVIVIDALKHAHTRTTCTI